MLCRWLVTVQRVRTVLFCSDIFMEFTQIMEDGRKIEQENMRSSNMWTQWIWLHIT